MQTRGHNDYAKLGDWNAICDSCGFKFKASKLRRRWDGMMVCPTDFETRHPQDLLRGRRDSQSVPWARPNVVAFIDRGYLVDEDGNYLTDEFGNKITA